jgi:hypothetical protein
MIKTGWFPIGIDRNRPETQPRLKPTATSHQCQPLRHPTMLTGVPPCNQETSGKLRSGPARKLTACVVNACVMRTCGAMMT